MPTFADYNLDPAILNSLTQMNYKEPSPVQAATIPVILEGKDLIALAQTGSGKTAACAIPVCHRVDITSKSVQALIVVPTRELARQYATEVHKIGRDRGVKTFAVFGGEDASIQLSKLRHCVHVLVATPGRLIDFIYSRQIDLSKVQMLILDEADEMLSMGFYEDLEFIMQCLTHAHQTLLFSATMPQDIKKIAKRHMKEPTEVVLTRDQKSPDTIDHRFVYCHHETKGHLLCRLIEDLNPQQAIVFCRSRDEVERVYRGLKQHFSSVDFLHGGLAQNVRGAITGKYRSGKIRLLVATDVAARGLDFSGISHVFIYHLADDPDIYVHRSGRTGRYEKQGVVVTLVTDRELSSMRDVLSAINKDVQWIGDPPPPRSEERGPKRRPGPSRRPPANRTSKKRPEQGS